jgi:diguanylate cyclase (GGDEF)-like protein
MSFMGANMVKKNQFSLASRGLRYKLKISFYLMSVVPILVCIYIISNYLLPRIGWQLDVMLSLAISIIISCSGFLVVKQVFDRIVSIIGEAKLIAAGDTTRNLKVDYTDEVDDLSEALNQLSQRIVTNMNELKGYSERTAEINIEIQERVVVFSSLLQVSSLISQGAKLDDVLRLTLEKSRFMAKSEAAYVLFKEEGKDIFRMKLVEGVDAERMLSIEVDARETAFSKLINTRKALILDKQNTLAENLTKFFLEKFKLKNNLLFPIFSTGKVVAILGIGNNAEAFAYNKEEIELLDIFAKQIAIAIENDVLSHRVEKLEIKDSLTGLYKEAFIRNRLHEEIKRAIVYQRPCACILFDIDNFRLFHQRYGALQAEAVLKKISLLIRESVTEIDRVGRFGDDQFAVILPERNKRRALEIAEDICKKVEFSFSEEEDAGRRITISGGLSENPLDGVDADELIAKAQEMLELAKKQGKNNVASFKEPPTC